MTDVTSAAALAGSTTGPASAARPKPPGGPRRVWAIVGGAVIPLVILGVWSALSFSGAVPSYKLPSPIDVINAGIELAQNGKYQANIAISVQRVFLGFAIGSVVGLSKLGSILLSPTIGGIRAVPSLAWVPLLILYLGINEDSKVTLIAIGALFPVYTTVATALRHVDPQLVELGRAFGRNGVSLLTTVQLPAVVPSIVAGLRLALAQSWLFLVAAELIASSVGLGNLLVESQNNGRLDRIFLAIVTLAVLGKATDGLVGLLERFLLKRWG